MNHCNRQVLILGFGISGKAVAHFFLEKGVSVVAVDRRAKELQREGVCPDGVTLIEEGELIDWKAIECVVASPGVSPTHSVLVEAKNNHIRVTSEVELACEQLQNRTIGITGTNGKTTVTLLVTHVLNESGIPACAVGNVGVPLLQEVKQQENQDRVFVMELSSYQLEQLSIPCFDVGLFLNLTPDHLDRYGTMERYAASKWRLLDCLKEGAPLYVGKEVLLDYPPQEIKEEIRLLDPVEGVVFPGALARIFHGISKGDGQDVAPNSFTDNREHCQIDKARESGGEFGVTDCSASPREREISGLGEHDKKNAYAALNLVKEFGVTLQSFNQALASFQKPPHRMEFVATINGVDYINDSKGTNSVAVVHAVSTVPKEIFLIAGGKEKGESYHSWIQEFKGKVLGILAIGEAAKTMERELSYCIPVQRFATLSAAVDCAHAQARPGQCVLLSPGCASTDQFRNFEHRGEMFKQFILKKAR